MGDGKRRSAATPEALAEVFRLKYVNPGGLGWGPRLRRSFGYFTPDDQYEAKVLELVNEGSSWLDVGCGRTPFPSNAALARLLSDRCGVTVGVDPDAAVLENPYFEERHQIEMERFRSDQPFDLVTMRMVAEHVQEPRELVASFSRCTRPGSLVVVYTVNAWSPVPLVTRFVPFSLHHPVKRALWGTQPKDSFPTVFRMNTRRTLRRWFEEGGFEEQSFAYLDDCRTFGRFRVLLTIELLSLKAFHAVGLPYPENCLLGVYRRA